LIEKTPRDQWEIESCGKVYFPCTGKRVRDLPIRQTTWSGLFATPLACNQYGNDVPSRRCETLIQMAKWKQYELWVQSAQNKWEIVGLFPSTELATVVANARTARTRLIEVIYDGSKMMGQEIIAELGNTRKE
jgi:hypothetical protein